MPKIAYTPKAFSPDHQLVLDRVNVLCAQYQAQGYSPTLRQLYYRFVASGWIANKLTEYKRLGSIINDGRLAGLIDWSHMEDRTRNMAENSHWRNPAGVIRAAAVSYGIDLWDDQPYYLECFPPDTPVITSDGVAHIAAIEPGDSVLAGDGVYRNVERVTVHPYEGDLYQIKAAGLLLFRCTPNHLLMVTPYNNTTPGYKGAERRFAAPDWVSAEHVKPFDLLRVPRLRGTSPVGGFFMRGGPRARQVYAPMNDDLCAVAGLYLAKGSVRPDKRTAQFVFGRTETGYADIVERWAASVTVNTHRVETASTIIVYLYSAAVGDWLGENFGKGAYHKTLPPFAMKLPQDQLLAVLGYWVRGDGHWADPSRSAIVATTRSSTLARLAQLALIRCGHPPSLTRTMDHGEWRYQVSVAGTWGVALAARWGFNLPVKGVGRIQRYTNIRLDESYAYYPVRVVDRVPYRGTVHNLEIDQEHSYCVPAVAHNCWVEKDALVNVLERVCGENDVPYFSCRGYTSQSEMWAAGQRLITRGGKRDRPVVVLHLGDHDPSGMQMTEDIEKRLALFCEHHGYDAPTIERIALNMPQVQQYAPPPNPAKLTDSRAERYIATYGTDSWELDALDITVIADTIRDAIDRYIDRPLYDARKARQEREREILTAVSDNWNRVRDFLAE